MALIRRHLRRGVVAWLVCHALTYTALVPRDCCAAHAHAARANAVSVDDAACPMHEGGATPSGPCAIAGTCQAPGAALAAVLLQAAVLEPVAHVRVHLRPIAGTRPGTTSTRTLATPPDAPPPRL